MKKTIPAMMLLLCMTISLPAQELRPWEQYLTQLMGTDDMESEAWQHAFDLLCDLEEHPMNINTATREDLEQLPFLTDSEVEDIMEHLYRYGPLRSMGELAMLDRLDPVKRQLLNCFFFAGERPAKGFPAMKDIARYGKHELMATAKIPMYERQGDHDGYLGYPYRHDLRYSFRYSDRLQAGIIGAQDAGEPFLTGRNKTGYDYYSAYLIIRKLGRIQTIAAGRYRLGFGMGLVMNTGFSLGKSAMLTTLGSNGNGIRAHSSRTAATYLQGAAATISLSPSITLTPFFSYRAIDATLNKETNTIATILTTGYHRTQAEMEKKDNARQLATGLNLHAFHQGFHIGTTLVYTAFDKPLQPNTAQLYRRYQATGQRFGNISIDYGYTSGSLLVKGETACELGRSTFPLATINLLTWNISGEWSVTALHRFYSKRYNALFAQSFSEGSKIQNESGTYLGISWKPRRTLAFTAYADRAYFPWPRYQVPQASHATDIALTATYLPGRWSWFARYRLRIRKKTATEHEQRARLSATYDHGNWSGKTQADGALNGKSKGIMLSESITARIGSKYTLGLSAAWFHTDDYDSRLYAYERGMLYAFSFPAYYGHGIRYSLLLRANLSQRLLLNTKVGTTDYFDRSTIGTGHQQINHSSMTDWEVQLRWKL